MYTESPDGIETSRIAELLKKEVVQRRSSVGNVEKQLAELLERVAELEAQVAAFQQEKEPKSIKEPQKTLMEVISHHPEMVDPSKPASVTEIIEDASIDVDVVDDLKQQLHDQLRNAEVEMALERARVFQQRAELEELRIKMKHDKKPLPQSDPTPESRLDKHIGFVRRFFPHEQS